ncbi:MAG: helix-turn-helix transcriptional regulator [Pseudomonadota bacterium]
MLYEQSTLSLRLAMIRKDLKLTQAQFADKISIPRSSFKNYENGVRAVPSSVLKTLVVQEGVDAGWLIAGRTKILDVDDDQLVADCMMLRTAIDNRIRDKDLSLTDCQKSDIIMLLIQKRASGSETDFYDRDLMCRLIRKFGVKAPEGLDVAAE